MSGVHGAGPVAGVPAGPQPSLLDQGVQPTAATTTTPSGGAGAGQPVDTPLAADGSRVNGSQYLYGDDLQAAQAQKGPNPRAPGPDGNGPPPFARQNDAPLGGAQEAGEGALLDGSLGAGGGRTGMGAEGGTVGGRWSLGLMAGTESSSHATSWPSTSSGTVFSSSNNGVAAGSGLTNPLPVSGSRVNANLLPQGTSSPNVLPGTSPVPNALPPAGRPGVPLNGATTSGAGLQQGAGPLHAGVLPGGLNPSIAQPRAPAVQGPGGPPPLVVAAPLSRQPANALAAPAPGALNPRAEAAAIALQGKTPGQAPSASPANATAQGPVAAKPGQPALVNAPLAAAASQSALQGQRAVLGAPGSAQAVAQAQLALAQTLGKVMAGQTTAGTGAMALAEAQLALRASKLALTQAHLSAQAPQATRTGGVPTQTAAQVAAAARLGASPGTPGAAQSKVGGEHNQPPAQLAAAAMPRGLAAALAMAPKRRKRGTYDRVEAVDRHTPRQQAPEMEDEDFWRDADDEPGDRDAADAFIEAADDPEVQRRAAALAAAQHYRALRVWLDANDQQVLLRELRSGRCVLVLAPPDKIHLRLIGHLLRPDTTQSAVGITGRAWALAARWSATLPADTQWRLWRVRQGVDAEGGWRIDASQPDRHTPRLLAADDTPAPATLPVGESIAVLEPRRLRRLMGTQWTMTVLRVPMPLNDTGAIAEQTT